MSKIIDEEMANSLLEIANEKLSEAWEEIDERWEEPSLKLKATMHYLRIAARRYAQIYNDNSEDKHI